MSVRLTAGRAALEIIIAEGSRPAPALDQLLPERQAGRSGALEDVGPTPDVDPLPVRVAEAERRALSTNGRVAPRRQLAPEPQGGGTLRLRLGDGCHRLMLLPETSHGHPVDVDAELHDARDRILVRDRSNASDASLEICVGEQTPAELVWVASSRSAKVTLLEATWALPAGLPFEWGPRARGAMAAAHRKRRSPALTAPPIWEGNGLPGRTSIPVEVAPDGCYVVGLAPTRGDQRSMMLSVQVGTASYNDTGGGGYESAMVSFCAGGARVARVDVESNGQGLFWVAAMWRAGRMPLGAGDAW